MAIKSIPDHSLLIHSTNFKDKHHDLLASNLSHNSIGSDQEQWDACNVLHILATA